MAEHRCPEHIFRMFDDEWTKPAGRKAAVAWLKEQSITVGDTVLMPNGATGEVESFTKEDTVS